MFHKFMQKLERIQARSAPVSRPDCRYPIACVVMAAGVAQRYQAPDPEEPAPEAPAGERKKRKGTPRGTVKPDNKLTAPFRGRPLLSWTLECMGKLDCAARVVVAREFETGALIPEDTFRIVWNSGKDTSPSVTIRYGLLAVPEDVQGCLFAVGDQPLLTLESVEKLCDAFMAHPHRIVALSWEGKSGNPVIFPRALFQELLELEDGKSGKVVMQRHPELVTFVEAASEQELRDIDTKAELRLAQEPPHSQGEQAENR